MREAAPRLARARRLGAPAEPSDDILLKGYLRGAAALNITESEAAPNCNQQAPEEKALFRGAVAGADPELETPNDPQRQRRGLAAIPGEARVAAERNDRRGPQVAEENREPRLGGKIPQAAD